MAYQPSMISLIYEQFTVTREGDKHEENYCNDPCA